MGTSRTPQELARKLGRVANVYGANREAVGEAALFVKNNIVTLARPATGGDMRLSGVGKNGSRLGVRYDVKGQNNATALVRATGAWQLIERDTPRHAITPKKGSGLRSGRRSSRSARVEAVQFGQVLNTMSGGRGTGITGRGSVLAFQSGGRAVFARYVTQGGGSRGRHPFERGVRMSEPRVAEVMGRAYRRQIAQALT